jgi:uncharacterized protein YjbI with pentapeptide repeats
VTAGGAPCRCCIVAVTVATVGLMPSLAYGRVRLHAVDASQLVRMLTVGQPVFVVGAQIRGPLRLPSVVRAPLLLRDSRILGPLDGADSDFTGIVDLSGSQFLGRVKLSRARFNGPFVFRAATTAKGRRALFNLASFSESAIFSDARIRGPVSFADAAFEGPSRFDRGTFSGATNFAFTSFNGSVNFRAATFAKSVWFSGAEFGSDADFTGARLEGSARFDSAFFSQSASFVGTRFGPQLDPRGGWRSDCANGVFVWTTFCHTHFNDGANFTKAAFLGVSFSGAAAANDLDFAAAQFLAPGTGKCTSAATQPGMTGEADFSTTRFLRKVTFSGAEFDCLANFDQARVEEVDLNDAHLQKLWLPQRHDPSTAQQLGGVRVLRLKVDDVAKVQIAPSETANVRRRELEGVLQLVEDGARAAGDLKTANEARVRRLSLIRDSRPFLLKLLDWVAWWGLLGYLVRPSHQVVAIVVTLLVGVMIRVAAASLRPQLAGNPGRASQGCALGRVRFQPPATSVRRIRSGLQLLWACVQDMLGVLFRLRPPAEGGARSFEYLFLKFLIVVLAINIGGVWPAFRDVVEGIF